MTGPMQTIRLELRLEGDSPNGRASAAGEEPRAFSGWIGLVSALDLLLRGAPAGGAASPPAERAGVTDIAGERVFAADGRELHAAVVDENEVRAAAGLTMVIGAVAFSYAYFEQDLRAAPGRGDAASSSSS